MNKLLVKIVSSLMVISVSASAHEGAFCSEDSSRKCISLKSGDWCDSYTDFYGNIRQKFCKSDNETTNGETDCMCSKIEEEN
jgi:hypothetical protein